MGETATYEEIKQLHERFCQILPSKIRQISVRQLSSPSGTQDARRAISEAFKEAAAAKKEE